MKIFDSRTPHFSATLSLIIISSFVLLSSCNKNSVQNHGYDNVRVIQEAVHPVLLGATTDQRFGSEKPTRSQASGNEAKQLAYNLPQGWVEVPLTEMRRLNVLIAGEPTAECYLTILPGGGSLRANIDRWCKQMAQDPISEEALLALPRVNLLGGQGYRFEIDGAFSGGMAGKPVADARMITYVLPIGDTTLFLKATGPRQLLESENENFKNFAASLRLNSQPSQSSPMESSLRWEVPSDWQVDSPRPMREVSFIAGKEARCWISLLGGDGGGALANTNRWRNEMGLAPISAEQLKELPTIEMLAGNAIVVEGTGAYSSMGSSAQDDWALIGLIRNLTDRTVFIKLVGPAKEVEAARDSLSKLASSLEVAR